MYFKFWNSCIKICKASHQHQIFYFLLFYTTLVFTSADITFHKFLEEKLVDKFWSK